MTATAWPGYPTSAQTDAESYIDTVLAAQWSTMIQSLVEGGSGAPTIGEIAATSPAGAATLWPQSLYIDTSGVGWGLAFRSASVGTSMTKIIEMTAIRGGTYSIWFQLRPGTTNSYIQVYVNGVAVGTGHQILGGGAAAAWTEDHVVNAGDKIQIYGYSGTANANWGMNIGSYDLQPLPTFTSGYGSF